MFTKRLLTFFIASLLSVQVLAGPNSDLHLKLLETAEKVIAPKDNAINLEQVKQIAVGDGIDTKIAYQRLLQAQKEISVARAQYFPYGTGLIFNYNSYAVWNSLILVELVTSLPSKFYNVRRNKNLRTAQKYSLDALKENIKKEVARIYYGQLKQEAVLKLVELEIKLLEMIKSVAAERVALGLEQANSLRKLEQRLNGLKIDFLKFSAYHLKEKEALNIILGKNPEEGRLVELQPVGKFINIDELKLSTGQMVDLAVENSPEIKASIAHISAAHNAKRSTQWSILSFSGLGFGYWGRVNIAKSKQQEMVLARKRVESTIRNQVYTGESKFRNAIAYQNSEKSILDETKAFMLAQLESFKAGHISLDELLEAQIVYLKDYREMIMAHYSALTSLEELKRAVLAEIGIERNTPAGNIDLASNVNPAPAVSSVKYKAAMKAHKKGRWINISIASNNLKNIQKVVYKFNGNSLRDMTSTNSGRGFKVRIKTLRRFNPIGGTYKVYFDNGQVQTKKFILE